MASRTGVQTEQETPNLGITEDPASITVLLLQWGRGDEAARERLIPLVHEELRQIARRCMAGERVGHSLQATALVNEAYVRLVDGKAVAWQDRAHFLAVSARVMRRILVDHARGHPRRRRSSAGRAQARCPTARYRFGRDLVARRGSASS